jgi:hypothetical protein
VIKTGAILSALISSAAIAHPSGICELAAKRGGLSQFLVQAEPDQNGARIVFADVDGDGQRDELKWFALRAGSTIPADQPTLTLTLTSNRKSFTLQQQRLYVVKFESSYYAVTTQAQSELGPWEREVFALTREGIARVCTFEGKGQAP